MRILWGSTAHPTPCLLIAFVWLYSAMWGTAHRLGHHRPQDPQPLWCGFTEPKCACWLQAQGTGSLSSGFSACWAVSKPVTGPIS